MPLRRFEVSEDGTRLDAFVAKSLVSEPDEVSVEVLNDDRTLELNTADDDRGRVIGRQGRVAKAMRALLGRTPGCSGLRLDIVD